LNAGNTRGYIDFCDRAALTYAMPATRPMWTQTMPKRSVFGSYATPWQIYDSYQEDSALQLREMEKKKKPDLLAKPKQNVVKTKSVENFSQNYLKKCQLLERMVYQNIFEEMSHGEMKALLEVQYFLTFFLLRLPLLGRSFR
jgi:hypothetical protein